MSSSGPVPETTLLRGGRRTAAQPWSALRRYGLWPLLRDSYVRFRYSDGFSHARSLALLLCLAAVPFLIALTGLAEGLGVEEGGTVVAETILALTPGSSDALVRRVLTGGEEDDLGELALLVGLVTGIAALTMAMGQVERGANRIYGIRRDRRASVKYGRAFVLTWVAGIPAIGGFLVVVAAVPFGTALERAYAWGGLARAVLSVLRWPVGLVLTVVALLVLFAAAPRRRQPSLWWLAPGVGLATALWLATSGLLGWYVTASEVFGDIYGPLTGVVALMMWGNLTAVALLFGIGCAAQLEAWQAGSPRPCEPDRWTEENGSA
ncbi:hypothetical protein Ppa06_69510 [Planomonospora parontospora subsp. parontospora]|nr:YihY/virulence factor BrkB family protein [Planomonospora parontospora]GII13153.1 hypothetical protein Ppa06_69510 [Planomonospora parontospora subsp. parontospora]